MDTDAVLDLVGKPEIDALATEVRQRMDWVSGAGGAALWQSLFVGYQLIETSGPGWCLGTRRPTWPT